MTKPRQRAQPARRVPPPSACTPTLPHAQRVASTPGRAALPRDCRGRRGIVWKGGHRRGQGVAVEPPRQGPVAQWLEPAAHNGLVGGSSPPGPTTHSRKLCVSGPSLVNIRYFNGLGAIFRRILVSVARNSVPICNFGVPVSAPKFWFPGGRAALMLSVREQSI